MTTNKPTDRAAAQQWEVDFKIELDLLVTTLRGGFTAEAVKSFGALGVLAQQQPEAHGTFDIIVVTRDEASEFLQLLQEGQEQFKHGEKS